MNRWACVCTLFVLVCLFGCDSTDQGPDVVSTPDRGDVISVKLQRTYTVQEMNQLAAGFDIPLSARYGAAVYVMEYVTVDVKGELIMASGAVVVPQPVLGSLAMVSFQHGTSVRRVDVPSAGGTEGVLVGLLFSSDGYLSVMPDLVGLGSSPGLHPYLIADVSASAVIDQLSAVLKWSMTQSWEVSRELFLAGYSSGGYTAMAVQRVLEANFQDEYSLVASAPMAGPYDLSGTMLKVILREEPYPQPYYLPYILLSYNEAYDLFDSPSDFLRSPYDVTLPPLFDGTHGSTEINNAMPPIPIHIVRQDVLQAVNEDPDHPFLQSLRENDLTNWSPDSPTRLYHCAGDKLVPIENSQIAAQSFGDVAALIDPSPQSGHIGCALIAIASARAWFNSIVTANR
ncbi:MAG: alpha/beta fold hydrolase [Bacteroidota bacterium]|nr:alpha/beta fold hydrolase [Bacteroidota bacterium]